MKKVVFWDFHGTLTYDRYGWSGTMLRILDAHRPGHAVRRETLSHLLSTGFPWDTPEEGHPGYNDDPGAWWRASDAQMMRVYNQVGLPIGEAGRLAALFRETYVGCLDNFIPYGDTAEALAACRERGYRNIIVSNHVPELCDIVAQLPFAPFIDAVVNSAVVGYEKPNPMIFAHAVKAAGNPDICWMVGDNYKADCLGALAAGIRPIWVHPEERQTRQPDDGIPRAETLLDAVRIITGENDGEAKGTHPA